jgi:hypothetical protein
MRLAVACLPFALACAGVAHGEEKSWDINATAYWNDVRGEFPFASGVITANHGALHLEGRANYEAIHAQSAFVGWTWEWKGDTLKVDATPMVGGVTGAARGPILGLESTFYWGKFDYYIEAEHVNETKEGVSSYNYAWTELGWHATEKLRIGVAGQRTRVYGTPREIQRGPLVQYTWDKLTLSGYWMNPGESSQIVILSAGLAF